MLIDALGSGMFGPIVLLYFHLVADLPLAQVGALASAAAVCGLVVPAFAGPLADRLSPRTLVIAGQVIQAVGFAGFLVAREPALVFASFVLTAAGLRVFWSTYFTMLSALPLPAGTGRERLFAVTGMVQAIGFGLGALVGGLLVAHGSTGLFEVALIVNVASYLISVVLLLQVPLLARVATQERTSGLRVLLRDKAFLCLIGVDAGFAICSDALMIGLPIAVKEGGIAHVAMLGPVLAMLTFVIATSQLFMTKRLGGIPRTRALAAAGLIWAVWAALMALLPFGSLLLSSIMLVALALIWVLAEMIHVPVANALAADSAPEQHRGTYLAAFQYGFAIANIVVPGAFTALFAINHAAPWLAVAGLATAAAIGITAVGRILPTGAVQPQALAQP
nr:MFS transporter [Kineosporia babensis]